MAVKPKKKYVSFTPEPEMAEWLEQKRLVKNGMIETRVPTSQIVKACISRCMSQDAD